MSTAAKLRNYRLVVSRDYIEEATVTVLASDKEEAKYLAGELDPELLDWDLVYLGDVEVYETEELLD